MSDNGAPEQPGGGGTGGGTGQGVVARIQAGDNEAFGELMETNGGRMLSAARRYLGNEADAEDAVQSAFMKAYKGIDKFEGESGVGTWLHKITVNEALMKIRTKKRKPEDKIEDFNGWYAQDRGPLCEQVPGVRRIRRYAPVEGDSVMIVLYEMDDESVRETPEWKEMNASEWTARVRSYYKQASGSPGVYRRRGDARLIHR